jgi:hypothetical protein
MQECAMKFRLQAVQIVCGPLCVSRCAENRALVFAQHVEPVADVIGVVRADLRRDAEVGAEEGGAEFRDEPRGYIRYRRSGLRRNPGSGGSDVSCNA